MGISIYVTLPGGKMGKPRSQRILAVSSGGGHWEQIIAVSDAFGAHEIVYATTVPGLLRKHGIETGHILPDCNKDHVLRSLSCCLRAVALVIKTRPDVVISTGAAPGLFCIMAGRLLGCRTVWIDSVANADRLSLSGRLAGVFATLWLTQWEHVSRPKGPFYAGAVL